MSFKIDPETFYTEREVRDALGLPYSSGKGSLPAMRKSGTGPLFSEAPGDVFIYRGSDLIEWLDGRRGPVARSELRKLAREAVLDQMPEIATLVSAHMADAMIMAASKTGVLPRVQADNIEARILGEDRHDRLEAR